MPLHALTLPRISFMSFAHRNEEHKMEEENQEQNKSEEKKMDLDP